MDRAAKRLQKISERDQRLDYLHSIYPELKAIDEAIAANGRAMLQATAEGRRQDLVRLERRQDEILLQQQQFLEKVGLDTSIYEIQWDCPLCQDRGYISPGQKCQCLISEIRQSRLKKSGLSARQLKQNFANFSLEWYKKPDHYAIIKQAAEDFAAQICRGEYPGNMLLYGKAGTGKTHICSAIANQLLAGGCGVIYMNSSRLFIWLRKQMFSDMLPVEDPLEDLCQVELLIIDDLGTETRTDFVEEQLFNLIDERIMRNKPWVISTNYSVEELRKRYDERIVDRILGESERYYFEEKSIRFQKKS